MQICSSVKQGILQVCSSSVRSVFGAVRGLLLLFCITIEFYFFLLPMKTHCHGKNVR